MEVLIDNKDLKTYFGIEVLNYAGALNIAAERKDERQWTDKSGVDKNLSNIRYDSKEFVFNCVCKASTEVAAYTLVNTLVEYMFTKGCFVLSLRDSARSIREAFICERSDAIVANIHVRPQSGLYSFKIGFKDINPNAVKYYTEIIGNSVSIDYTKGQSAILYWGNGDIEEVSNSGIYTKSDYTTNGLVDVFIDIDKDADTITPLTANFAADSTSGVKPFEVNFTDASVGDIIVWSWDFGDGGTSSEQNPTHTYTTSGIYTVTLQVFNTAQGVASESKLNYISLRDGRMLINDAGDTTLINTTDHTLIN